MKQNVAFALIFCLASTLFVSNVFAGGKKDSNDGEKSETAAVKIENKTSSKTLRVATLNGPTSIPVAYFYANKDALKDVDVQIELCAAANIELPKLLKGEVDIGFLPPNAAAKVFTSNNGALVCLGVSDNGNISLITTDSSLKDFSGLKGKKVAVAGAGATPEYMFRYLLSKNEIEVGTGADKVELDFSIATSEIAAAVVSGKVQYAVVPEPFGTVASMKGAKKAIDFQKEFEKVEGNGEVYPITVIVAKASFVKENQALVEKFLAEFKKAIDWTNSNPQKSGVAVQENTLGLLAPVVANSIPAANFVFIPAKTARPSIEKLLGLFLQFAPESIGGAMPSDEFYYGPVISAVNAK